MIDEKKLQQWSKQIEQWRDGETPQPIKVLSEWLNRCRLLIADFHTLHTALMETRISLCNIGITHADDDRTTRVVAKALERIDIALGRKL